ncbi:GNAT family N-acetyltransferase [Corynebacterium suedekumii]|nr:GNAT family N-acetyltransferase [Corynebacterium suedekumii]
MAHIAAYAPKHRDALLDLSLRAWEPIFPALADEVPASVYASFYPGAGAIVSEPISQRFSTPNRTTLISHSKRDRPVGWVCTRLHPDDAMGEVYVLVVEPSYQRRGIGKALMEHAFRSVSLRRYENGNGRDR